MKINGRVHLRDLRSISQQEFDTACRICEKIRQIVEARAAYINEHNLDQDIALPADNWAKEAPNAIHDLYQLVITHKYDVINNLRLYTQPFTGYQLSQFSMGSGKTAILYPIPDNFDDEIEQMAPEPDHWVYRYITITRHIPKDIIATPPKILGEIGWDVDGSLVNHDTYVYQERLNLLYEAGIIDWLRKKVKASGGVNILEVGAGYGGLAYYLKHIVPEANYYICDIPESLLFSSLYLAIVCSEYSRTIYDGTDKSILYEDDFGFKFIPNFMFDNLVSANIRIDLAINTLSFSEMSEKQVRYYAQNLSQMLGDTGVLFEQNPDSRPRNFMYCKLFLPDYFKSKRTVDPMSIPELVLGAADIWANKRISDNLRPIVKWWMLLKIGRKIRRKCFVFQSWSLSKIGHVVRRNRILHRVLCFIRGK